MEIKKLYEGVHEVDSRLRGPTVAIIGGVHGNEATGILTVQRLLNDCQSGQLRMGHGKLILIIGNPWAVEYGERHTRNGQDLNRMFSQAALNGHPDCYEGERARILSPVLAQVDVAIDIHATNLPSRPFVVCQRFPETNDRRIIRWLGASKVVTDPNFVFAGEPVTVDEFVIRSGGIGLCYETGDADDTSRHEEVMGEMRNVLREVGLISSWPVGVVTDKVLYCLERSFCLGADGFRWEEPMGAFNFQPVGGGQTIGWHGGTPEIAESDGVIIFPKVRKLWQPGQPLGYFARELR